MYYQTTLLADETDPNRLRDLKAALDGYQVHGPEQVDELVERYLSGAGRDRLPGDLPTGGRRRERPGAVRPAAGVSRDHAVRYAFALLRIARLKWSSVSLNSGSTPFAFCSRGMILLRTPMPRASA